MAVQSSNSKPPLSSPRRSPRKPRPRSSITQTPKSTLITHHNTSPSKGQRVSSETGSKSQSPPSSSSSSLAPTGIGKRSWVWLHFKSITVEGLIKHVCQVEIPSGATCGTRISPERSSSTKNLIQHLNTKHKIFESSLPEAGIMQNFLARGVLSYVSHQTILALSLIYHILKFCFDMAYFTSSMDN